MRKFRTLDLFGFLSIVSLFSVTTYLVYPGDSDIHTVAKTVVRKSAGRGHSKVISDLQDRPTTVAIFTACKGRHDTLNISLPTWRRQNVAEIIILDWYSTPPLKHLVPTTDDPRLRVYTMTGQEEPWILSRAFNLAARLTSAEWILKVDCDTGLEERFFDFNRPQEGTFISGDWRKARSENEKHLNGVLFVSRSDFFNVGGYDERIVTYGWDDSDMVMRLHERGLAERTLAFDYIYHIQHEPTLRTQFQNSADPSVEIQKNRMMIQKVPRWSNYSKPTEYEMVGNDEITIPADYYQPPSLRSLLSDLEMEKIEKEAYQKILNHHGVPWSGIRSLSVPNLRSLLNLHTTTEKLVIVQLVNGLESRIRALASAMSIARGLSRKLILAWPKDFHCNIEFNELFTDDFEMHNYLQSDHLSETLFTEVATSSNNSEQLMQYTNQLFFRSEAGLRTVYSTWHTDAGNMKRLHPHPSILEMVNRCNKKDLIGIHIPNPDDVDVVPEVYRKYASGTMSKIIPFNSYRLQIAHILKTQPDQKFFIATVEKSGINDLKAEFPGHILYMKEACTLRIASCIRIALAEIIVLSRAQYLMGDAQSSFSEVVAKFAESTTFRLLEPDEHMT